MEIGIIYSIDVNKSICVYLSKTQGALRKARGSKPKKAIDEQVGKGVHARRKKLDHV